jgi:V/A-type H+/Na+-transporting ATPase subunit E
MGIEDIQKEVLSAAEHDAQQLKKDAEKKAREIVAVAKERTEEMRSSAKADLKKATEKERKKAIEAAHFESATGVLKLKKELMDAAIADAKAQLSSIPAEKRKKHIQALIKQAQKDIQVQHVLCSKKDMPFVQGFKVEEAPLSGGIIAENQDRTMRVDLSYNTIFSAIVEERVEEIYTTLFGSK